MKTSKQSKTPLWRKSMLKKLGLSDIKEQLWEISDNGDMYGYEYGDESGYYAEYKDQFTKTFKNVMLKCDFKGKKFDDLTM